MREKSPLNQNTSKWHSLWPLGVEYVTSMVEFGGEETTSTLGTFWRHSCLIKAAARDAVLISTLRLNKPPTGSDAQLAEISQSG